ncbi:hypothetical protein A2U01_0113124, partial [Trifolium medium]|nr:hypothetical protein [Trifolium medium]
RQSEQRAGGWAGRTAAGETSLEVRGQLRLECYGLKPYRLPNPFLLRTAIRRKRVGMK